MSRKHRLLIVEDEDAIRAGLVDVFVFHGYEVEAAADGRAGLDAATRGRFDLILLDVMLPSLSGFDICRAIRARDRDQPIIMLTARTRDEDIIEGLQLGADDYVAKPFSVTQLVLRVKAVLRRSTGEAEYARHIHLGGDLTIDASTLAGRRGQNELAFTRREIDLLQYLHAHRDRAVAREELLSRVWGYAKADEIETRTVDIHVANLRRKIEASPKDPKRLVTVRGRGYRLVVE